MVFYVLRIHKTKLKRRLRNLPSVFEDLSVRIFVREIQEDDAAGKGCIVTIALHINNWSSGSILIRKNGRFLYEKKRVDDGTVFCVSGICGVGDPAQI